MSLKHDAVYLRLHSTPRNRRRNDSQVLTEKTFTHGCAGKKPHPSKAQAEGEHRLMTAKGIDTRYLRPYKCKHCRRWHLGNDTRRGPREES